MKDLLPGPVVARAALHARLVPIVHPGNAPPEPRYTPSRALADFVRGLPNWLAVESSGDPGSVGSLRSIEGGLA